MSTTLQCPVKVLYMSEMLNWQGQYLKWLKSYFSCRGNDFFTACDFLKPVSWNKPLTSVIWTSIIKQTNKLKRKTKPHIHQVEYVKLKHAGKKALPTSSLRVDWS